MPPLRPQSLPPLPLLRNIIAAIIVTDAATNDRCEADRAVHRRLIRRRLRPDRLGSLFRSGSSVSCGSCKPSFVNSSQRTTLIQTRARPSMRPLRNSTTTRMVRQASPFDGGLTFIFSRRDGIIRMAISARISCRLPLTLTPVVESFVCGRVSR